MDLLFCFFTTKSVILNAVTISTYYILRRTQDGIHQTRLSEAGSGPGQAQA